MLTHVNYVIVLVNVLKHSSGLLLMQGSQSGVIIYIYYLPGTGKYHESVAVLHECRRHE